MGHLTRFQHQVIDIAERHINEKKEEKRKEMQEEAGAGTGTRRNPRAAAASSSSGSHSLGGGNTVRYVNESVNGDSDGGGDI